MIKVGENYRHYKGNEYTIIALAIHTETSENMVVYSDIHHPDKVWVRPQSMFTDVIIVKGKQQQRFMRI